jgi:lipoprotein signal peptidase
VKNNSINSQNIFLIIWGIIVVFFDQTSKYWAGTLKSPAQFLFFSFEKFYNPGISFG